MEILQLRVPFGHSYHKIFEEIRPSLKQGAVLMYAADTCWGLSTPISSEIGIQKIYEIKNRPTSKAVSIAVSDIQMAHTYGKITKEVENFMKKNLPGKISLIVEARKENFPKNFTLVGDTISIRIPSDSFTRRLAQSLGEPLITTSANISGEQELYTWKSVEHFLEKVRVQPDIVLYKEKIPLCKPSTMIDTTCIPWKIVRQGNFILNA